jgi:hypothetical protein
VDQVAGGEGIFDHVPLVQLLPFDDTTPIEPFEAITVGAVPDGMGGPSCRWQDRVQVIVSVSLCLRSSEAVRTTLRSCVMLAWTEAETPFQSMPASAPTLIIDNPPRSLDAIHNPRAHS